jgi:hypothetical protein
MIFFENDKKAINKEIKNKPKQKQQQQQNKTKQKKEKKINERNKKQNIKKKPNTHFYLDKNIQSILNSI